MRNQGQLRTHKATVLGVELTDDGTASVAFVDEHGDHHHMIVPASQLEILSQQIEHAIEQLHAQKPRR